MRHNWTWKMRWLPWLRRTRRCIRCGAALRQRERGGTGPRYSYRGPDDLAYRVVRTIPPCDYRLAAAKVRLRAESRRTFPESVGSRLPH